MKKFLAISLAVSMLFAIASCGGDKDATSSTAGTSSTASVVSNAPVPSVAPQPSTPDPVPTRENLALTATPFDDGSDEYYNADSVAGAIIDGNTTVGWQYKTGNTEQDPTLTSDTPNVYATDEGDLYLAMTFEDGIYIGLTWEEAVTVNEFQFFWEFGSRPVASEEGYIIEISKDGEEWEELDDAEITYIETETPGLAEADVVTFEAMEIKGVRAVVYKSSTKYSPKLWELEVYGPEAEAETESTEAAE